jgi:hypothetical protein
VHHHPLREEPRVEIGPDAFIDVLADHEVTRDDRDLATLAVRKSAVVGAVKCPSSFHDDASPHLAAPVR